MNYIIIFIAMIFSVATVFCLWSWIAGLKNAIELWRVFLVFGFIAGVASTHFYGLHYLINVPICTLTAISTHMAMTVASRHFIDGNHR